MSAKAKQLIIIYTAAALVTLSVLSAVLYSKLAVYPAYCTVQLVRRV